LIRNRSEIVHRPGKAELFTRNGLNGQTPGSAPPTEPSKAVEEQEMDRQDGTGAMRKVENRQSFSIGDLRVLAWRFSRFLLFSTTC